MCIPWWYFKDMHFSPTFLVEDLTTAECVSFAAVERRRSYPKHDVHGLDGGRKTQPADLASSTLTYIVTTQRVMLACAFFS